MLPCLASTPAFCHLLSPGLPGGGMEEGRRGKQELEQPALVGSLPRSLGSFFWLQDIQDPRTSGHVCYRSHQ